MDESRRSQRQTVTDFSDQSQRHYSSEAKRPSTGMYTRELSYRSTPERSARASTPSPYGTPTRQRQPVSAKRGVCPGAQGHEVEVNLTEREYTQRKKPLHAQQTCPPNPLTGRWRRNAAGAVDDFTVHKRGTQPELRLGQPMATSTPAYARMGRTAQVSPALAKSATAGGPNHQGVLLRETAMRVRGGPEATRRGEHIEVDSVSRQQRQVSFDVPSDNGKQKKDRKEIVLSTLKKFDRDATAELRKRRQQTSARGMAILHEHGGKGPYIHPPPASGLSLAAKNSMGAREIEWLLRETPDSELIAAVDRLAQAEAAVVYDGAVRAAQEAAAKAPPELAEEAAAAGARTYRAEITHSVQEVLEGEKPIEIIGYVGITRPR